MSTLGSESQGNMKQEEKELLDLYYACVDHDKIDHDLILKLLIAIHTTQPHGAVLVFLPGYEDISIMYVMVSADTVLSRDTNIAYPPFSNRKCRVYKSISSTAERVQEDSVVYKHFRDRSQSPSVTLFMWLILAKSSWNHLILWPTRVSLNLSGFHKHQPTRKKGRAERC